MTMNSFSFHELLSELNPLQYLPVIGTIYRSMTGDLIPEPVEYVKKELGVPAVCTDMAGLPRAFEPGSFDLLTAFQVIEHVPDVAETG